MNENDCTCERNDCYSCRRMAIDAKAIAIFERELNYGDTKHAEYVANHYRYAEINKLAYEF